MTEWGEEKAHITAPPWDNIGLISILVQGYRFAKSDPGSSDKDGLSSDGVYVFILDTAKEARSNAHAHDYSGG